MDMLTDQKILYFIIGFLIGLIIGGAIGVYLYYKYSVKDAKHREQKAISLVSFMFLIILVIYLFTSKSPDIAILGLLVAAVFGQTAGVKAVDIIGGRKNGQNK
jgi:NhaP-type Na+/H+ or K+/H+ antiporter